MKQCGNSWLAVGIVCSSKSIELPDIKIIDLNGGGGGASQGPDHGRGRGVGAARCGGEDGRS